MKAFVIRSYGPADQLVLSELDTPVPGAGEVLVRVRATSVNPYDWHYIYGEPYIARLMPGGMPMRVPRFAVPGCDMAGTVAAVGRNVTRFKPGDEVFALLRDGGFAEYVSVSEDLLARMPGNLSHEQAASVPMAGATALVGLRDAGLLKPGQRVLVNGASGGVGTFAVQVAVALGATVTGVCGASHGDLVRSLGAREVIDYRAADFTKSGQRFDLVLDVAGSRSVFACRRVLERTGTLALVGGPAGRWVQPAGHVLGALALSPVVSRRVALADVVGCRQKRELLDALATLIEDGKVTPVIDRGYPFGELPAAVGYQREGHAAGKVVVTVAGS